MNLPAEIQGLCLSYLEEPDICLLFHPQALVIWKSRYDCYLDYLEEPDVCLLFHPQALVMWKSHYHCKIQKGSTSTYYTVNGKLHRSDRL